MRVPERILRCIFVSQTTLDSFLNQSPLGIPKLTFAFNESSCFSSLWSSFLHWATMSWYDTYSIETFSKDFWVSFKVLFLHASFVSRSMTRTINIIVWLLLVFKLHYVSDNQFLNWRLNFHLQCLLFLTFPQLLCFQLNLLTTIFNQIAQCDQPILLHITFLQFLLN